MRDKEIVGLYQAYLDVYSNLNEEVEQLDEISPEVIARTDLRRRKNLWDAQKEEDSARDAGATMGERSKVAAKVSAAAAAVSKHRRLSSAHARSRARMNKEEVENWVNSLIEEGYDLSEYTWDDMYEMYLDEERRDPRGRVASGPMSVYGGEGQDAGPGGSGNVNVDRMDAAQRRVKATQPKKKGTAADALFTKYSARQTGMEHGGEEGPGPKAPKRSGRSGRGANTDRGSGNAAKRRMPKNESVDLFDAILEHLVAEGYADTNESALAIMANMSEEWRQSILDEAYQEPRFGKKDYLKKLSKRGGMGMGTPEDPHGYRDSGMAKVGAEFSKRKTAAAKAKRTGEPDSYRAEKEAQSKNNA